MREYLGIPYKDFGRDKEGLDCWGLCVLIAKEKHGYILPSLADGYTSATDSNSTSELIEVEKLKDWDQVKKFKAGDVAVFRFAGFPCHVGMCLDGESFIHILHNSNVTIERFDSIVWRNRLTGVYRRCKKLF